MTIKPRPVPKDKQTIVSFARRLIAEGCPLDLDQRYVFKQVMDEPSNIPMRKRPQMGLSIGQTIMP